MPFRGLSVEQARAERAPILSYAEDEEKNEVTVEILDEIGGWGVYASEIIPLLRRLDGEGKTVFIRINSPGGDVFEGIAIANTISGMVAKTVSVVDGMAASIASIIAIAADERRIHQNAAFMVHRPWSLAIGEAGDMRKVADILDQIEKVLIDTYEAAAPDTKRAEHAEMVAEETWLFGPDAIAVGYAHVLVEKPAAKAAISAEFAAVAQFKNIPENLKMSDKNDAPNAASTEDKEADKNAAVATDEKINDAAAGNENDAPSEVTYSAGQVKEINALCAKAKMPEKAQAFMDEGVAVEDVRARLFDAMVEEDSATETKTANAGPAAQEVSNENESTEKSLAELRAKQFARFNNHSRKS